jgi:[ribosomal protein S5]-alanine N-acetyltransferase
MQPILQTPRLYLRHFTIEDAPLIMALNTPTVLTYIHENPPKDIEDAKRILNDIILPQYALYNLGRFAIHAKEDNRFVGWCGLKFLKEYNEVDLGYRYMDAEWGKGFATEAAKACLQFGFEERNLTTIIGRAHIDNIASQKVLQKTGLTYQKDEDENGMIIKVYTINSQIFKSHL